MTTNDSTTTAPSSSETSGGLADYFTESPAARTGDSLDDNEHQIGARLAEARTAAGLTPEDLAVRLGVKETTITKWEEGSTSPRGHVLSRIAGLLGVSLSWLIMGRGVEPSERDREIRQLQGSLGLARGRLSEVLTELDQLESRLAALGTERSA